MKVQSNNKTFNSNFAPFLVTFDHLKENITLVKMKDINVELVCVMMLWNFKVPGSWEWIEFDKNSVNKEKLSEIVYFLKR